MRQYIGARYVPKIYQNSQNPNSAEWENVAYEPFTIVTFQNNSYISRKDVPVNSGNPTVATAYWAVTGFYNGQIAALDNRLQILERVKGRKFILVGDSLGLGVSVDSHGTPTTGKGWGSWAVDYIGSDRAKYVALDGGGFTADGIHQWLYQLQNMDLGSWEDNEITDLVILGGSNDQSATVGTVFSAMTALVSYVRDRFENLSRIAVGIVAEPNRVPDIEARYSRARELGCEYISDLNNLLCNATLYDDTGHTHLSQDGYAYYAPFICNAIVSGHTHYHFQFKKTLSFTQRFTTSNIPTGFTMPAVQYDITEHSKTVRILPVVDYAQGYQTADLTVIGLPYMGIPDPHPTIATGGANAVFYDGTKDVYVTGFDLGANARSQASWDILNSSNEKIGYARVEFLDYRYGSTLEPATANTLRAYVGIVYYNVPAETTGYNGLQMLINSDAEARCDW